MQEPIDGVYLPFTELQLREHFVHDGLDGVPYQALLDPHTRPYVESARTYHKFCQQNPDRQGMQLSVTRRPCQIEKDERFWTATAMLSLYHGDAQQGYADLLRSAYGDRPPLVGLSSWEACLEGDLRLYLEVKVPSPAAYRDWLSSHLGERHFIPYVLDAAGVRGNKNLEGPTVVDAVLLNRDTQFAVFFESKVLSDASCQVSFDVCRNQLARNIDAMLEPSGRPEALARRCPDRTLFCLLTPELFRSQPHHRLYGRLLREYTADPTSLGRDLAHREGVDWAGVAKRIGWATWEDCNRIVGGRFPWMSSSVSG